MLKVLIIPKYCLVSFAKKIFFEKKVFFLGEGENFIISISNIISVEAAKAPMVCILDGRPK